MALSNAPASPSSVRGAADVQRVLDQATYFVIFSVADPEAKSTPVPLVPFIQPLAYQINLIESPRRLAVSPDPPNATVGLRTSKLIGNQIANQTLGDLRVRLGYHAEVK